MSQPTLRPLSSFIGAEVIGLDLKSDLDEDTRSFLKEAWLKHLVLLFRNQELSESEQVNFAKIFGTPRIADTPRVDDLPDQDPAIVLIGNIHNGNLPDGEVPWHSDSTWYAIPNRATMLYAIETPSKGGNTRFMNMYDVYDSLFEYDHNKMKNTVGINRYQRRVDREPIQAAHPVFLKHPVTRRTALYVNRLHTKELINDTEEMCGPCWLRDWFKKIDAHEYYEHVWSPGDLIVWDNRCTQHSRTDFDPSETRLLKRVGIQ